MDSIDAFKLLSDAHQRYVAWWLPIDVAAGSCLAPMSFLRFLEALLTLPNTEFFDRWIETDVFTKPSDSIKLRKFILRLILMEYTGFNDRESLTFG